MKATRGIVAEEVPLDARLRHTLERTARFSGPRYSTPIAWRSSSPVSWGFAFPLVSRMI